MAEKVTIGNCELWHGDCREVLPLLPKVDAVISDPPYGVGFKYSTHDDNPAEYSDFMKQVIGLCDELRGDGPACYWQGMLNADRWHEWFPKGFRIFAACKGFVQYRPTPIQFSWDPVIFFGTPKTKPTVYRKDFHIQNLAPFGSGREKINHPCPRPLEQVVYVVDSFSVDGDTVLDPFLGSGTTGVACAMLGRNFIGIEKDESYFIEACRRIEQAYAQPRLFEDAKVGAGDTAVQGDMLLPANYI